MLVAYVLVIVVANVVTAMFQPLTVAGIIIPCGSFLVGVTFFLRDFIQLRVGKRKVYKLIVLSAVISGFISLVLGDALNVAIASVISFFGSEALDTEVFTRLRVSVKKRIVVSGLVGGVLDSTIFIVLALSPIGSSVLPWESVPYAILGQTIVKCCMQLVVLPLVNNE
jgi:uncharacterized PurR-regulated membrane protein YhhQ (DUF165 family)